MGAAAPSDRLACNPIGQSMCSASQIFAVLGLEMGRPMTVGCGGHCTPPGAGLHGTVGLAGRPGDGHGHRPVRGHVLVRPASPAGRGP
jgi:hypothetical protein